MGSKTRIKEGDHFIHKSTGDVLRCVGIGSTGAILCSDGGFYPTAYLTKLPASPATMAKSHRLLMRW